VAISDSLSHISSSAGNSIGAGSALVSVDVNPMSGLLAAGDLDGRLSLFDVNQRCAVCSFSAHSDPVSSVRWHCGGVDLLTSGGDGVVRVWDSRFAACCKNTVEAANKAPMSVTFALCLTCECVWIVILLHY
jgi:WD40 repeat protein